MKISELNSSEIIKLAKKMTNDFVDFLERDIVPEKCIYKIPACENISERIKARTAALQELNKQPGLTKVAFDTRNVNQEFERNPRSNLQYWHRSDQFINTEEQGKIDLFAKLLIPLNEIKDSYGNQPEYFNSYARQLHDTIDRTLKIKEGNLDLFRPQIKYLEQLLDTRYRLTLENISDQNCSQLKEAILKKDEELLKRGALLSNQKEKQGNSQNIVVKDGNTVFDQQALVQAIFGNNDFRRTGEKSVTRTITIAITDTVNE